MFIADEVLLNKLGNFAATFKVAPPQSNNILEWWSTAIKEASLKDIYFIQKIFKIALKQEFELAEYFQQMNEVIEKEIEFYENVRKNCNTHFS